MSSFVIILIPVKISASGIFGVIKLTFFINFFFNKSTALSFINFAPPLATITWSNTIFLTLIIFNDLITELITFSECNIPILIASGLISSEVNSI